MYKVGGFIVECFAEEYQGGWRAIVRLLRDAPSQARRGASAQYAVPAFLTTEAAAHRAAFLWARRLIESNRSSIDLALLAAELDEETSTHQ